MAEAKKVNVEEKIKNALEKIRPSLQADGGDVEFKGWEEKTGTVKVRLAGMCAHCPMSQITLQQGIETEIKAAVSEVKQVVAV